MKSYRESPDSEANQKATRQNEHEIFALKMSYLEQTEHPMETTKHTPGKWVQLRIVDSFEAWICTEGAPLSIAQVLLDIPAGKANADLICAAPALLAALEDVLPFVEEDYHESHALPPFKKAMEQARAAIAQARGEKD